MSEIELTELLRRPGQTQAGVASRLGVTQGAVSQMVQAKRRVFVVQHPDGRLEAYEKKPVGKVAP